MNFEDQNGEDGPEIMGKLYQILLTYDNSEVKKWINRLEIKMESYGIQSQWNKRIVLEQNLPSHIQDKMNSLFEKRKTEAGPTIYKELKTMLLKLHGPKEDANFKLAMSMVMTENPSTTAKKLTDLICLKAKKLEGCCCAVAAESRWGELLPSQVRAQVANMSLKDDFSGTCDQADKIYESLQLAPAAAVAAIQGGAHATSPAPIEPAEDVAAFRPNRGRGQQPRGRQGNFRGGGRSRGGRNRPPPRNPNDKSTRGPPHEDGPPPKACINHYVFGRNAYFCRAKSTCPWRHLESLPADD